MDDHQSVSTVGAEGVVGGLGTGGGEVREERGYCYWVSSVTVLVEFVKPKHLRWLIEK